jgi:ribosomal protein S18 acetylase RimI-like enzyme
MITVRAARADDAPAIAALAGDVHALHATARPDLFQPPTASPATPEGVAALIAGAGPLFVVAEVDGGFAGYARALVLDEPESAHKRARRVVHVDEMGVLAERRRSGTGRALLAEVARQARALGAGAVTLEVYGFNAGARAFYAREGFGTLRERLEHVLGEPA